MSKQPTTPTITLSEHERKQFLEAIDSMTRAVTTLRDGALYINAVRCFMIYKYKLHTESGLSWKSYRDEVLKLSRATTDRYIATARKIETWARGTYRVKNNEPLLMTTEMVIAFVAERKTNGFAVDIKSLIEPERKDKKTSETVLETTGGSEITTVSSTGNQEHLFSLHERITTAGYLWKEDSGKYETPEGREITNDELSEFVDDRTGMQVFEETKNILVPVRKDISSKIRQFKQYFLVYRSTHRSPNVERLIESKHQELRDEILGILHDVSTMLLPEEQV